MLRRRLVLSSSSDEEDEQPNRNQPQSHFQPQVHIASDITPKSLPRRNPNPNPTSNRPSDQPLYISDDEDFIDVSDHFSPPQTQQPTSDYRPAAAPPQTPPPLQPPNPGGCPTSEFLRGLGLRLRRDWLSSCVDELGRSVPGFDDLEVGVRSKLCFEKFLVSDMNFSGSGVLPENVDRLNLVDLPGPYVLQVDEIVNISCPLKGRYQKAPPGFKRCLKLSMTDGVQRVFGMEYQPMKDLDALAPAGLKVMICNVHIRHGLLMLVPEVFEVLGGLVEELEAARQRLVEEVNKPPRGIRTRNREVPPLRTRATLAAWPPNGAHVARETSDTTPAYTTTPFHVRAQGVINVVPRTDAGQRIEEDFSGFVSEESVIRNPSSNSVHSNVVELPIPGGEESVFPNQSPDVVMAADEAPDITMAAEDDMDHMYTVPNSRTHTVPNTPWDVAPAMEGIDTDMTSGSMTNHASGSSFIEVPDDMEVLVADEDIEHPLILPRVLEVPFTYLASLSAKWTSKKENTYSVQGMIKCFLTGVKGFQFRDRTTYDLQVYVDDGSLISEIIIHHDVVQRKIGYSPQEVTAAFTSPDTCIVNNMREVMKQYQSFLINFEGKMLVEINVTSPLPVALEMSQGCPETDAILLLRRLKSSLRAHTQPYRDHIDLSP